MLARRTFLGSTAAALAGAAAFGPHAALAASPRKASIRFNWTMKGEFTPFVVAREKGFYRAAGIDVDLNPGTNGTQAVLSVAAGHDDFAYVPSIQLIEAVNRRLPVRAIATCGTHTGMCWASRADVPLTGPRSLEGHRVSISPSSTFFQIWDAFAKRFNIDVGKVEVVHADPSARVALFLDKRVDIMADIFAANDFVILESKSKEKLNQFRVAQVGFDPLGYLLVTSTGLIDREPEFVRTFTTATLRGFEATRDQPDDAAGIMARADDRLSPAVIRGQVHAMLTMLNDRPAIGRNDPGAWTRSIDILRHAGVITEELAAAQYYTNAFVG